jgi:putative endonuclease
VYQYYVYILASKRNGTLYVGVTNDLIRRVAEHKSNQVEGFTKKYKVNQLVHFEDTNDIDAALNREKQLKKWKRAWKLKIIEESNPEWRDLYPEIMGDEKNSGFLSEFTPYLIRGRNDTGKRREIRSDSCRSLPRT